MRLAAVLRRQSTRITITNGAQPGLDQASGASVPVAVERALQPRTAAEPWPGPVSVGLWHGWDIYKG
jgi:hypothetical protein